MVPGQGLEPRPLRSERDVLPVRRSRTDVKQMTRPDPWPDDVFQATRLPFDPGSPLIRNERRPTWRGFGAASLVHRTGIAQAKAHASLPALFPAPSAERRDSFSLRRGLDSI